MGWAKVRVAGQDISEGEASQETCGYRYGLASPSVYDDYEEALRKVDALNSTVMQGHTMECWLFPMMHYGQTCEAVALEDPHKWSIVVSWRAWLEGWLRPTLRGTVLCCILVSALFALAAQWCKHHCHDCWDVHLADQGATHEESVHDAEDAVSRGPSKETQHERATWLQGRWTVFQTRDHRVPACWGSKEHR